jgi:hypothetical protein
MSPDDGNQTGDRVEVALEKERQSVFWKISPVSDLFLPIGEDDMMVRLEYLSR